MSTIVDLDACGRPASRSFPHPFDVSRTQKGATTAPLLSKNLCAELGAKLLQWASTGRSAASEGRVSRLRQRSFTSKMGMGMGLLFTTAEPDQPRVLGSWLNELSGGGMDQEEQPNVFLQRETAKSRDCELRELRKIVSELVALLNSKNILNDYEGMALLRKLSK